MIKLIEQDMFSLPSDAIVIPCNDRGEVSAFVDKKLKEIGLDERAEYISSGEVCFKSTEINNKEVVLIFAASVEGYDGWDFSSPIIVNNILSKVNEYASRNNLTSVNLPLIGTGAGGLSEEIVANCIARQLKDSNVTYNVCVLSKSIYQLLQPFFVVEKVDNISVRSPRVFISYASNDLENELQVKELIIKLRQNGVDARGAMFHLRGGVDLPQWMTNEIILADKVLLICDKYYVHKSDLRSGGVGWETMIIQGDMLSASRSDKYIAVVKDDLLKDVIEKNKVPIFMKSKYYLEWATVENKFDDLLNLLFDTNEEPKLGAIPQRIIEKLKSRIV